MGELKLRDIGLLASLATTGLVGCSQSPAEPPGTAIAESAVPHIRAGMWDYAWSTNDGPAHEGRYCDAGRPVMHRGSGVCTNVRYRRTTNGDLTMDMDCKLEGAGFHLHKVVTGDLRTAFSTDGYSWDLPKPVLDVEVIHQHTSQRYLGACPPGMVPRSNN